MMINFFLRNGGHAQADPQVAPVVVHVSGVSGAGIELKFQLQVRKGQLSSEETGTARLNDIAQSGQMHALRTFQSRPFRC